jgi:rfaE bifunctional protein nucleotidyltransferase chain/domain
MERLDVIQDKIFDETSVDPWLARMRFKNRKIVFTNGCFDILHQGHLVYLSRAADAGDMLVIGLNSDSSLRRLKGSGRPYLDQQTRALLLASLSFVDAVVIFYEDTPLKLIEKIQPDVLIKGSDYKAEEIVGYDIVRAKGGEVLTIDLVEGFSSSDIIARIKDKQT